jgi:hypothetical protein
MSLKALANNVLARNQTCNSTQLESCVPEVAQRFCATCRNLRMSEIKIPGIGGRFFWGCAAGHMEHGHATPALGQLTASESCLQAGDYRASTV